MLMYVFTPEKFLCLAGQNFCLALLLVFASVSSLDVDIILDNCNKKF